MVYHKESHFSNQSVHDQPRRGGTASRRISEYDTYRGNQSRHRRPERQNPSPPQQRRRWATGYIDRRDCPSYPYIDTYSHSPNGKHRPDAEYIDAPDCGTDDYIQPRQYRHRRAHHAASSRPLSGHGTDTYKYKYTDEPKDSTYESNSGEGSTPYGSDVESLDSRQSHRRRRSTAIQGSTSRTKDGLDVAFESRPSGSDVESLRGGRRSISRSDTQSIVSLGGRSDVQKRRARRGSSSSRSKSESESDSEGGYISLDDYIARSDCVSDRAWSGDGGEGSDAVGNDSDEESYGDEGSDAVMGSDVESWDNDGERGFGEDWSGEERSGFDRRYTR